MFVSICLKRVKCKQKKKKRAVCMFTFWACAQTLTFSSFFLPWIICPYGILWFFFYLHSCRRVPCLLLVCTRVVTVCSLFLGVVTRPSSDNFRCSVYVYIHIHIPASGWPVLFLMVRFFSPPPMGITCHFPTYVLWMEAAFFFETIGTHLPDYTLLWPTELWYESSSPWKSQVFSFFFSKLVNL